MATPPKKLSIQAVRDTGFASTLSALKYPFRLERRDGIFYFVFEISMDKFREHEAAYWGGTLLIPAREIVSHLKTLKDCLYSAKRQGGY